MATSSQIVAVTFQTFQKVIVLDNFPNHTKNVKNLNYRQK